MDRVLVDPRPNWEEEVEKWGMFYHTHEGSPYWFESAYYALTSEDVQQIEEATADLHVMCMQAVEHVVKSGDFERFKIPVIARPIITDAWNDRKPHLYGRMDLAYDGVNPPKLLEYNADTPTALLEAAVVQWKWSQDVAPGNDQFNEIYEALVERWTTLREEKMITDQVHFAHEEALEDLMTVSLLRDTAQAAGLKTIGLHMTDIGWNAQNSTFTDLEDKHMNTIFKLYPWEWMVRERFSVNALSTMKTHHWIEPIWKMILSNKAILAVLWELFPGHKNLLPAYLNEHHNMTAFVKKPILSREGANVSIVRGGLTGEHTDGPYGKDGFVYQELFELPNFDGSHPVIGSWVVGDEPCGVGIRESDGLITTDLSRFVPNIIVS